MRLVRIYILLLTLTGVVSRTEAQVNVPGNGAIWTYTIDDVDLTHGTCFYRFKYVLYADIDSTINGYNYTLLKLKQTLNYTFDPFNQFYCSIDTFDHDLGIFGGIRSLDEKTYFYGLNNPLQIILGLDVPDTTDVLVYDFSKIPGDTLPRKDYYGYIMYDSIKETSYVTLADGVIRKQQTVVYKSYIVGISGDTILANSDQNIYVEGIGDIENGLFFPISPQYSSYYVSLNCYKENEIYLLGDNSCENEDAQFETPTLEGKTIIAYPNPFKEYFRYEVPYDHSTIRLYTLDGKLVLEQVTDLPNGYISTRHIPNGAYIVTCTASDGKVAYDIICKAATY